jgi:hypothetical protein
MDNALAMVWQRYRAAQNAVLELGTAVSNAQALLRFGGQSGDGNSRSRRRSRSKATAGKQPTPITAGAKHPAKTTKGKKAA